MDRGNSCQLHFTAPKRCCKCCIRCIAESHGLCFPLSPQLYQTTLWWNRLEMEQMLWNMYNSWCRYRIIFLSSGRLSYLRLSWVETELFDYLLVILFVIVQILNNMLCNVPHKVPSVVNLDYPNSCFVQRYVYFCIPCTAK